MIKVENLVYDYPNQRALDQLTFKIKPGSITALVGPNGAGKTTLLRCLSALTVPLSGTVLIDGVDTAAHPQDVHLRIGYLQDIFGLYEDLTVKQSLQFMGYSRLHSSDKVEEAVALASRRAGVDNFIDKKIQTLSRGMRQRVGIAMAIIHQPKLLILDEPASGLDPEARHGLSKLLIDLKNSGMTIIVSSHILAELEDYSTQMLIIRAGKIIDQQEVAQANQKGNLVPITIQLSSADPRYTTLILLQKGISELSSKGQKVHFVLDTEICTKENLLKELIYASIPIEEFASTTYNLQEEYIKTVEKHQQSVI